MRRWWRRRHHFSTTTLKGYTVNPYSKGSKNRINVGFHKGGMPPQSTKPMMMLDFGGKALQIEWKASECLYSDKKATSQGIHVNSACYTVCADTMDRMHQAGVRAVDGYYLGAPQVIHLDQECMGNPKTCCWSILTNNVVYWEDHNHVQFNSMYITTLKVVKDRHNLVSGPKLAGITQFRNVTN